MSRFILCNWIFFLFHKLNKKITKILPTFSFSLRSLTTKKIHFLISLLSRTKSWDFLNFLFFSTKKKDYYINFSRLKLQRRNFSRKTAENCCSFDCVSFNYFHNCFLFSRFVYRSGKLLAKAQENEVKSQKENLKLKENCEFSSSRKIFFLPHQTHTAETERLARKRKKRMRKSVKEIFCLRIFRSLTIFRGAFHSRKFLSFLLFFSHLLMAGNENFRKNVGQHIYDWRLWATTDRRQLNAKNRKVEKIFEKKNRRKFFRSSRVRHCKCSLSVLFSIMS